MTQDKEREVSRNYWGSDYYYAQGVSQCGDVKCSTVRKSKGTHRHAINGAPSEKDFERVVTIFRRLTMVGFLQMIRQHRNYVYYVGKSRNAVPTRFRGFEPGDIHSYAHVVYWLAKEDCEQLTEHSLIQLCEQAGQCEYNVVGGSQKVCDNYYMITQVYRTITADHKIYYDKYRTAEFADEQASDILNRIDTSL
jgi:hypothetical protein